MRLRICVSALRPSRVCHSEQLLSHSRARWYTCHVHRTGARAGAATQSICARDYNASCVEHARGARRCCGGGTILIWVHTRRSSGRTNWWVLDRKHLPWITCVQHTYRQCLDVLLVCSDTHTNSVNTPDIQNGAAYYDSCQRLMNIDGFDELWKVHITFFKANAIPKIINTHHVPHLNSPNHTNLHAYRPAIVTEIKTHPSQHTYRHVCAQLVQHKTNDSALTQRANQ